VPRAFKAVISRVALRRVNRKGTVEHFLTINLYVRKELAEQCQEFMLVYDRDGGRTLAVPLCRPELLTSDELEWIEELLERPSTVVVGFRKEELAEILEKASKAPRTLQRS